MPRATVQTPWVGTGTASDPRRPRLADDFHGLTWADAAGLPAAQLRAHAGALALAVQAPQATLDAIAQTPPYAGTVTETAHG